MSRHGRPVVRSSSTVMVDWCVNEITGRNPIPAAYLADLERISIVILSRSRPDFLLRQVAAWAGLPTRVIIMDGSDYPLEEKAREFIAGTANVEYRHRPVGIAERLREVSGFLVTPFTVLLGDDEFFLASGLVAAIRRLDEDDGLAGCIGQSLIFRPVGGGSRWVYDIAYPHWRYCRAEESVEDRLVAAFDPYTPVTPYAVLRTPVWARSWGSVDEWTCSAAIEVQMAIGVLASGRVEAVDAVQWLRSVENPPVDGEDRKLSFVPWWQLPDRQDEHDRFVSAVAAGVEEGASVDPATAERMTRRAIDSYVSYVESRWRIRPSTWRVVGHDVAGRARKTCVRMLGRILGDRGLLGFRRIRVRFLEALGRPQVGYLGTFDEVGRRAPELMVRANPALGEELAELDRMLVSFHRQ